MSSTEAAFSYTGKDTKGNLCTVRGDSYAEFVQNLAELFPDSDAVNAFLASFSAAVGAAPVTPAVAVQNVQQAFPQAQPVAAPPFAPPQAQAYQGQADVPPPVAPKNCAHGPMTFKNTQVKTGQRAGQMWARWECAIPWSRDAVGRCANVNA